MKIIGTTIGWEEIGLEDIDEQGNSFIEPYDLDPIMLYQNSELDTERNIIVGLKIKEARKAAGMTQEELAQKSGTSKHYISRLENNKSDIELLTLKKIVEAGLNKHLRIQII
jgi:DNA-binding XRE family transcriptional regulator